MYITPKINLIMNGNKKEEFFCKICEYCLITGEDFEKNKKYKCCEECFVTFVEATKDNWDKDNMTIDKKKLQEYIYIKNKLSKKKISLY